MIDLTIPRDERPLATMAEIAAACDPERLIVRKCVGCETFDLAPVECARCYRALYPAKIEFTEDDILREWRAHLGVI